MRKKIVKAMLAMAMVAVMLAPTLAYAEPVGQESDGEQQIVSEEQKESDDSQNSDQQDATGGDLSETEESKEDQTTDSAEGEEHVHVFDEIEVRATCTKGTYIHYSCQSCDYEYDGEELTPANGHTPVSIPEKAPTATENGHTEGQICSVCDEILVEPQVKLMAPILTSLVNEPKGMTLTWKAVDQAEKYRVFRKSNGSTWIPIADTTETSLTVTDVVTGTDYKYTVRCISEDGKTYTSSYDKTGLKGTWVAMPNITSLKVSTTGITVKWDAVKGAESYTVYAKPEGGSWTFVGNTTTQSLKVPVSSEATIKPGTKYSFTVRAEVTKKGVVKRSGYEAYANTITWLGIPGSQKTANNAKGVKVKWDPVSGASKYIVYYRKTGGSWATASDLKVSGTSCVVSSEYLVSGTAYEFTVRAVAADKTKGLYDNKGVKCTYLAMPTISTLLNSEKGIEVRWDAVDNVDTYRVYFRSQGEDTWTKAGDVKGTSVIIPAAKLKPAKTYEVMLRGVGADGKTLSAYDKNYKTIVWLSIPVVTKAEKVSDGAYVEWDTVDDAVAYILYYKKAGGKWVQCDPITENHCTLPADLFTLGTKYIFTVRALNEDNVKSGYIKEGTSMTYMDIPKLKSVSNAATGVTFKWNAVEGAVSYRLFYKEEGGSWKNAGSSDTTTFTVPANLLNSGKTYIFTARGVTVDGTLSGYDKKGISIVWLSTPTVKYVQSASRTSVTWNAIGGAKSYTVYRKLDGSWEEIASTTTNSYIDTKTDGKNYTYTVRAVSGTYRSSYLKGTKQTTSEEQAAKTLDRVGWNLKAAYNYSAKLTYYRPTPVPSGSHLEGYASYGFTHGYGNCYVMAATFCQMARQLGYECYLVEGWVPAARGGLTVHGWTEIIVNGKTYVCDPNYTNETGRDGYMMTYSSGYHWIYQNYHRVN